jgi:hypothetical protein
MRSYLVYQTLNILFSVLGIISVVFTFTFHGRVAPNYVDAHRRLYMSSGDTLPVNPGGYELGRFSEDTRPVRSDGYELRRPFIDARPVS